MYPTDDLAELLRPPVGPIEGDTYELLQLLNPSAPPVPRGLGGDDGDSDDARAA